MDSQGTRTGTKVATKAYSIDPVNILNQFMAEAPKNENAIVQATNAATGMKEKAAEQVVAAGAAASDAVKAKGDIEAAERQKAIDVAAQFGVGTADDAIVAAHAQRAAATNKMDALRPVIDAADKVTWWDDPLQWVQNQFTQPILKREFNSASREATSKAAQIASIQQAVAQKQAIDLAPTMHLIKKRADAEALSMSTQADAKALELRSDAATISANAAMQLMQQDNTIFNNKIQVARMLVENRTTNAQMSMHADNMARLGKAEKEEEETLALVNFKQRALGQPEFKLSMWKQLDKPTKNSLMMNSMNPSIIGSGYADSFRVVAEREAFSTVRNAKPGFADQLQRVATGPTAEAVKASLLTNESFKKLSFEKQQMTVLEKVQEIHEKEWKNNKFANTWKDDNPLKLDFRRVTQRPELVTNPFAMSMAAQQAKNPSKIYSDNDILLEAQGRARANVKDIPKIAKELTEFYRVGLTKQYFTDGSADMGLPRLQEYGISVKGAYVDPNGVTRGLMITDVGNVEHYLMQQVMKPMPIVPNMFDTSSPFTVR